MFSASVRNVSIQCQRSRRNCLLNCLALAIHYDRTVMVEMQHHAYGSAWEPGQFLVQMNGESTVSDHPLLRGYKSLNVDRLE